MSAPIHTKAWVLRRWPWKEAGLLIEVFSEQLGLVKVIFPGGKKITSKNILPQLHEFIDILITGKQELKNGKLLESLNTLWMPYPAQMLCLNFVYKLMIAFMRPLEQDIAQFNLYSNFIAQLQSVDIQKADYRISLQKHTLQFGLQTIKLAGYFPASIIDISNQPLLATQWYYFDKDSGWIASESKLKGYRGEIIKQVIENGKLSTLEHRKCSYSIISNVINLLH